MSEKLKGIVTISRTINLGNYNSTRIEYSQEFYLDYCSPEQAFREAQAILDAKIKRDETR